METQPWTVWGIGEISDWSRNFSHGWPSDRDVPDFLDAHMACGIRHVGWELGRSVLTYHSDLPGATSLGRDATGPLLYQPDSQLRRLMAVCRRECRLRRALSYGVPRGITFYGRLAMNRHYTPGTVFRSRFAQLHPQWCEVTREGQIDVTRLSFAVPEYRAERIAVLLEAVKIGCQGLLLDFCRQPPMVLYHPNLVRSYRKETGVDPRVIGDDDRDAFLAWCRFRSQAVTQFLRELKEALQPLEKDRASAIPVQARVPNDGLEANLIAGLDVEGWCREGLIDELSLSELRWLQGAQVYDDGPYVGLGRTHGLTVYASACCLPVMHRGFTGGPIYWRGMNPYVLAQRILSAMQGGAQGVSFYQTDVGVQIPAVARVLAASQSESALRALLEDPAFARAHPVTEENYDYGVDNHSALGVVTA